MTAAEGIRENGTVPFFQSSFFWKRVQETTIGSSIKRASQISSDWSSTNEAPLSTMPRMGS